MSFVDYDSDEDYDAGSPNDSPTNSNPNTTVSTEPKIGILKKKIKKQKSPPRVESDDAYEERFCF